VGPSGRVLATDIDCRWLASADLDGVEVMRHDIAREPLPESAFDLVHARLVLVHIPERAAALSRLVAALKPGGWLVIEDFDIRAGLFSAELRNEDEALANAVTRAFFRLLEARGADLTHGGQLIRRLREAGLSGVAADGHVVIAQGGSASGALMLSNVEQLVDQLPTAGVTPDQVSRYCSLLKDPDYTFMQPIMVSARGRRVA
jgi:SAM-dependent methyltransferase